MSRRPFDTHTAHVAAWLAETGKGLLPDPDQAERFLRALDPRAAFFSFRSYSDTPYTRLPGRDPLEHSIHGSLSDCWGELVDLNRRGAAIAVTINATSGLGRDAEHIERVRALFVDDDQPERRRGDFPLPPHIRVRSSPGRFHAYWLVRGLPLNEFKGLQRRLAECFRTDHRICVLNQVMTIPGFWRRKQVSRCSQAELLSVVDAGPLWPADIGTVYGARQINETASRRGP